MSLVKAVVISSLVIFSNLSISYSSQLPVTEIAKPLIVGGEDAEPNEFPFQVSIQYKTGEHYCGGSLIAPNWVVTAAHCMDEPKEKSQVVTGLHDRSDTTMAETFEIANVIIHEKYNEKELEHDIALVELKGSSHSHVIKLNKNEIYISPVKPTMVWVAGWGITHSRGHKLPNILQKVQLPLVPLDECNSTKSYNGEIKDHMICAGFKQGGKDSCQSDSGGPLFLQDATHFLLVGIVSYGDGCAVANKYGVYTKVNYFVDWIEHNTALKL